MGIKNLVRAWSVISEAFDPSTLVMDLECHFSVSKL